MSTNTSTHQPETTSTSDSVTAESITEKSSTDPTTSHPDPAETSSGGTPPAEPPSESQQTPEETTEEPETDPKNKEAAKYRVRLREAEAERDGLATRLDSLAEHVIAGHLKRHGLNTDALRAAGHRPTEFFNDAGEFQPGAVDEAAAAAAKKFGFTRPIGAGYVPSAGTGPDGLAAIQGSGWDSVINPR